VSTLPVGWATAMIDDLVSVDGLFSDGDWVESKDQDPLGNIRLLQLADIGDGVFLDKSNRFVNEHKFEELRCTEVFEGDVLIARMPEPLGRACLASKLPNRCITVVDVAIVRPGRNSVSPAWLMRTINAPSIREAIDVQSSGTTRRRITRKKLAQLELPVSPLKEQQRIADKLDAVLARVDACRERLGRVPGIIKRFRQAVLIAATCGELTADWRDVNGLTLGGWASAYLGHLVIDSANGLSKRTGFSGSETTVLRLSDFKNSRRVIGNERAIKLESKELEKYRLDSEDILVVRVNGSRDLAGRLVEYIPHADTVEAYCDHFIRLRLDRSRIEPKFALFVANSGKGRAYLEGELVTSAGQNTINQKALFSLEVVLPPQAEQREIIRRVETLFAYTDRLEARYAAAHAQVEHLTPALLAKAFRGELVPQDPDDEPASVLLESIRAERAAAPAKPKQGRVAASSAAGRQTATPSQDDQAQLADIARLEASRTERGEDDQPNSTYLRSAIR
jgi:type I restriction enzyme, S subunit